MSEPGKLVAHQDYDGFHVELDLSMDELVEMSKQQFALLQLGLNVVRDALAYPEDSFSPDKDVLQDWRPQR